MDGTERWEGEISQGRDKCGGRWLEGPRARPRQTGVSHTTPRDFKAVCEHGRQGAQEPYQDGEGSPSAWFRRTALPAPCKRTMAMI